MRCEQSATWAFQPSDGESQIRVQMAIIFQTPIPGEDLASVSILAPWELFPDELPWEMMKTLRTAIANGFHVGRGFAELPLPPGGIDIEVTELQIEPLPVSLNDADVKRLADALYWAAAGMAMSCWRGLHALSAEPNPE